MYISINEVEKMVDNEDGSFVGMRIRPEELKSMFWYDNVFSMEDNEGCEGLVADKNGVILYYDGYFFSTKESRNN